VVCEGSSEVPSSPDACRTGKARLGGSIYAKSNPRRVDPRREAVARGSASVRQFLAPRHWSSGSASCRAARLFLSIAQHRGACTESHARVGTGWKWNNSRASAVLRQGVLEIPGTAPGGVGVGRWTSSLRGSDAPRKSFELVHSLNTQARLRQTTGSRRHPTKPWRAFWKVICRSIRGPFRITGSLWRR